MRGDRFTDRRAAGRALAEVVRTRPWIDPIVLGLVRGGVPVAYEVARALNAELDVAVALKIGAPGQPEFGIGAVTPQGPPVYDEDTVATLRLGAADLRRRGERVQAEARRRDALYRNGRPAPYVSGRSVLIVDDGLATGVTARAALRSVGAAGPGSVVVAVPVGARDSAEALSAEGAEVICVRDPVNLGAVGAWYRHFEQVSDDEVLQLLEQSG